MYYVNRTGRYTQLYAAVAIGTQWVGNLVGTASVVYEHKDTQISQSPVPSVINSMINKPT